MGRLGVSAYSKSGSSSGTNLNAPLNGIPFDDFDGRFTNTISVGDPISRPLTPEPGSDIIYSDRTGILRRIYPKQDLTHIKAERPSWKLLRSWITEIMALLLAVCALLSIVSVLRVFQGKAVADIDLPSALTLNGLLALLGTILRAVLAVPLGSILSQEAWLWLAANGKRQIPRSRLRDLVASDTASRGEWGSFLLLFKSWRRVVAVLGALVMVLCLAIDTFTQQLITSSDARVTDITSDLNPGNIPWTQHYASFQGNPAEDAFGPTLNIKAAAYAGFLSDSIDDYQVDCPTGDCTFPETPSVALCGNCVPTSNSIGACNETSCSYTTSTGTVFEMGRFNNTNIGIGFSSRSILNSSNESVLNLTVADFEAIGVPYQSLSSDLEGSVPVLSSQRCQMWMCVNVYKTAVTNGQQTQNITASYNDLPNTARTGFSGGDNWTFILPEQWNRQKYNVSTLGWTALGQQLSTMVTGTILLNLEGYSISSDSVEAIWNGTSGDMQQWIDKVTRSLSTAMRLDSTATDAAFDGSAYQLSIVVRWGWLALPASLVLISIVLLVIIMTRTARSDIGSWKGSPLAMLLFEVDDELKLQSAPAGDGGDWSAAGTAVDSYLAAKKAALERADDGRFRLRILQGS